MSMFEMILSALPLLNFILLWVLKPVWDNQKALQKTIDNQQEELKELKKMNELLRKEVEQLKELVFKTIPADKLQEHLICHIKP